MGLPVNALSDEELEGYAGIEPAAATELAKRIATGYFAREERVAELEVEVADANNATDEAETRLEDLRNAAESALDQLKAIARGDLSGEEEGLALKRAIKHLEDEL